MSREPRLWIDNGNAPFDAGTVDVMGAPYCGNALVGDVILASTPLADARAGIWRIGAISGRTATVIQCLETGSGGGGGASSFTDLTDAPDTITADSLVIGNHAGDALEMRDWVTVSDNDRSLYVHAPTPDPDGYGVGVVAQNSDNNNVALIYASDDFSQMRLTKGSGPSTGIDIRAYDGVTEVIFRDDFKLTGADVVATDAAATMTVNAVEYSIAKAIKVTIGSSTYFWPLFGPVAP